jgi:SSS family solute:Na+ symporter
MDISLLIALILYFAAMLAIGLYAYRVSTDNVSGYLLGGRQLGPAVTALSAGASDMSGWIIMGLPGAVYLSGLSNIWIGLGLVVGAYLNYLLVAPRLRAYTEIAGDSITLPDFFENRFEDSSRLLRIVASIVIIVFFTVYTSSGLVGGGKLFETAFGQSYELGLYVTAGVVVLYTLFGGFLAVSMTDFVQGCIMFIALILVPTVAVLNLGGIGPVIDTVNAIDAKHLLISNLSIAAVISSLAWGLGYFGQPHIIVRFMAIRSVGEIKVARRIGMSWIVTCLFGAMATGFVGIAFIHQAQVSLNDPEAIFILLSQLLFHPFITGFLLAAVLAAIMSTVSSQLLVTSSSLTEDIYKAFLNKQATEHQLVFISRVSVVLVAMLAIYLAHNRDSSILQLVSHAWAGFGAAFGPMILLSLYWPRMTSAGALAGIVVGAGTVLVWIYAPISIAGQSLSEIIYAMVPGFLLSTLAIVLFSRLTNAPSAQINAAFLTMETRVKREV